MIRKLVFLSILSVLSCFSYSQETDKPKEADISEVDTNYIAQYQHVLSLKLYENSKTTRLMFYDKNTPSPVIYGPNEKMNFGIGATYKWFGAHVGMKIPTSYDNNKYGETKRIDMQANLYLEKFVFDLAIQRYKGYYLTNPEVFRDDFNPNDPFPVYSDILTYRMAASIAYYFNRKKFSHKASFAQSEIQRKGAGTPVLGSYVLLSIIGADSTLIPRDIDVPFVTDFNVKKSVTMHQGLSTGYIRTFVIKEHFYTTLSALGGMALTIHEKTDTSGTEYPLEYGYSTRIQARAAIGYTSRKFFTGFSAVFDIYDMDIENLSMHQLFGNFKIFMGYRFNIDKFEKKWKGWRNRKKEK